MFFLFIAFVSAHCIGQNQYYIFNKNIKAGVINRNGDVIIPAIYDYINIKDDGYFICAINDSVGAVDTENQTIIPFIYNYVTYNGLFTVQNKSGKFGVVNHNNEVIIPICYDIITSRMPGYYTVTKKNKMGLIDQYGKIIMDTKYQFLYTEGTLKEQSERILFREKDWYGYIDIHENLIIPPKLSLARPFSDGQAIVWSDSGVCVIDTAGEFIIEPGNYSYINKCGGIYIATKNSSQEKCLLSLTGKLIICGLKENDLVFINNTAIIEINGEYGLIDNDGKYIIPLLYDGIGYLGDNGLIPVLKDGKWGFVNTQNELVIDFKFVGKVEPFSDGLAIFYSDSFPSNCNSNSHRAGYINEKGKIVIQPQYLSATMFINGRAVVETDSSKVLINKKGKPIFTLSKYDLDIIDEFQIDIDRSQP